MNTDLILSLLKADLRNNKLIINLNNAGVLVEDFYTDLSMTIFQLMGFENEQRDNELYGLYIETVDRLCETELNDFFSRLNALAIELYAELLAEKRLREKLDGELALTE